jgi:hypothetical protein
LDADRVNTEACCRDAGAERLFISEMFTGGVERKVLQNIVSSFIAFAEVPNIKNAKKLIQRNFRRVVVLSDINTPPSLREERFRAIH